MEPYNSELSILSPQGKSVSASRDETAAEIDGHRSPEHEFSLPPVDGGKDAWLFLAAAFIVEVLVWGKASPIQLKPRPSIASTKLKPKQDFHSRSGFSKNTILHTHHLQAPATSPSLEPVLWDLCISLHL
jgi:hypothetical protein